MKFVVSVFLLIHLSACAQNPKHSLPSSPEKPIWIQRSDKLAEEFTKSFALLRPEVGSEIGYQEFDHRGLLLDSKTEDRDREFFALWILRLNQELANSEDKELKTDIFVLQNWLKNQVELMDSFRAAREVAFVPASKFVFGNLQPLLNPQSAKERKLASIDRFKTYVRGGANHLPLLEALKVNFRTQWTQHKGKSPLLPFRGEVEQYLKDADSYLAGIEELLKTSGRNDWAEDWQVFKIQALSYRDFVKNEVLVQSRKSPRVPLRIYTQILKSRGIERTPAELISTGQRHYKKIYQTFREQADLVGKKLGLKNLEPALVIKKLKENPVTTAKAVEELYKAADLRLEKIIKENDLVSIPASPLKIRVAGDAESKAIPVPHLIPPPLINNQGERPEFVVPSSSDGLPFDDFASSHSAIILTAHEGRPGHDLQFSQMLDSGLSVIRSRYAMNNVNVEGWGLYAEDLVFEYLTPEEKLFALQSRLWRVARMFLDPQLQLGQISDRRVVDLFTKELGGSEVLANLELKRYKYSDIGQAPSYFEGYLLVIQIREEAKVRLASKFDLKCFNDTLLSYGLLPLRMTRERMKEELNCL